MAKQVSVEIEVNSSQVDQTVQKLGQLKDLGKGLKIQYDIDGRPIDVAIDKSLNLQKQVKLLTAELRRTKEGTAEFQLLSTKLGDAQDQLAKTTAKSKDLFTSLSMIPGPVGQFFSQLQGGIELLKTFSSFTFKDLQFQFKETANDIADIGKNLGGIDGKAIDGVGNSAESAGEKLGEFKDQLADTTSTAAGVAGAARSAAKTTQQTAIDVGKAFNEMGVQLSRKEAAMVKFAALNKNLALSSNVATRALELQTVATEKAAFWTTTLGNTIKSVLISTGVLIAIVAIGELVMMLYKMVSAEEAAAEATKKLNRELENQNLLLDLDAKAASRRNNEIIALMKSQGKSESEIRKVTLQNSYDDYSRAYDAEVEARRIYNANLGKVDAEGLKAMEKNLLDREQATKDAYSSYKVLGLNQKAEELKEQQSKNKELEQKNKQYLDKVKADNKSADDMLLELKKENTLASIENERTRQYKELELQAATEVDKVNALEISEEKKGQLRNQIFLKYSKKQIELKKKFDDEDIKKVQEQGQKVAEYTSKLEELRIAAIEDANQKEVEERRSKFSADLKDLYKAYQDKLISQEQYNTAVTNLQKGLDNDLKKIEDDKKKKDNDDKLKKLDDDLKFLEISNNAQKNSFVAYWKGRKEILDVAKQRELSALDLTEAQKIAIEKKYAQLSKDLQREKFEAYVGYLNQGLGAAQGALAQQSAINNLEQQNELDKLQLAFNAQQQYNAKTITSKEEYDKQTVKNERELALQQDKVKEEYFYKNRNAQYAQAMISAFQAAISAYSAMAAIPVVGPALGAAAAAIALAFGIKQANLIKKQQYVTSVAAQGPESNSSKPAMANFGRNYEQGGLIGGKRHAEGGTLIEAEKGEAIMTRGAVTMFAPLLSTLNQMGGGTSFSRSAMTTSFDAPIVAKPSQEQTPIIVKTYVVSGELTSEQNKQARLKDLSTL